MEVGAQEEVAHREEIEGDSGEKRYKPESNSQAKKGVKP